MDQERLTKNGMGSKIAAQRKVFQELGIKADQCEIEKIQYLTRILYSADSDGKWAENEMDYILFLKSNLKQLDVDPNPEEVKNVMYLNKASLTSVVEFKRTELIIIKVFTGITESRKSFSQSRQCSTDLNESFGFHLKLLVSL